MNTMDTEKFETMRKDADNAVASLREVLDVSEKNDIIRDSAIKRFEYSFDIIWKFLKTYLEIQHAVIVNSPKSCFREAYRVGVIEYDQFWLDLCDDRNRTAHTYNQKTAEEVYANLPEALTHFEVLLKKLA